ncbi:MAG TPA: tetratricopeptide repeat protein [Anaerolineae bacterium]|nr:tetratricopeptide repeat protein [Anaerolineae bacterium]
MYYRPKEKKRGALLTLTLYALLTGMLAVLVILVGIYIGYFEVETPTLAKQFEPTPTPTRPAVLYVGDGDAYFAQGKLPEAIDAYEQAIEIDPTNDVPFIRLSRLLIYTRDTGLAVERAAQAVLLKPNSPENLAHYCRALDWEGRYAEAIDICSCAIELNSHYAEAYAFLSEVYADVGNWPLAQENAQQALDLNFQSMDAHHNMGYALEVQGRYPEAVKFYENAITLAPNLGPLYIDAGRIYQAGLGDYETAAERYKKAIKLNPFDPEGYDLLGWAFYFSGDYVQAINALEQSLGVDPNYVNPFRKESAWGHLATVYYTRQNFESAIEYFPKAIELAEGELLRRVRQIEIHAEAQTLTGPSSRPILRGRFSRSGNNLNFVAQLEPVNYVTTPSIETEQSCADLVAQSIEGETILLSPTESLTETLVFSQTSGTATLDPTTGNLFLDLKNLPQPETTPYEIKVTFWPNRTDSVGYFQPQADQQAQVNIQFNEKSQAPIEYYYQLGLAYAYLDNPQCDKAVPWLLRSLEIDSSGYSPAWAGLRICPSPNSPPTPIPTWTPEPTDQPQ